MTILRKGEARELFIGFIGGVVSGVISIVIASNYIARKASEATIARTMALEIMEENIYGENPMPKYVHKVSESEKELKKLEGEKLSVSITTSEFYNNMWNPVLKHTFYGPNEEELLNLIEVHKMTDRFFAASFEGEFKWRGSTIQLKNSEPRLLYA